MNSTDRLKDRAMMHLYRVEEALSGLTELLVSNENNMVEVNSIHLSSLVAIIRDRAVDAHEDFSTLETAQFWREMEKAAANEPLHPDSMAAIWRRRGGANPHGSTPEEMIEARLDDMPLASDGTEAR